MKVGDKFNASRKTGFTGKKSVFAVFEVKKITKAGILHCSSISRAMDDGTRLGAASHEIVRFKLQPSGTLVEMYVPVGCWAWASEVQP